MSIQVPDGVVDLLVEDEAAAVTAARRYLSEGAVRLGYRAELDTIEDPEARRARYEELVAEQYTRGKALSTAAAFEIDDVIDPADTRAVLTGVLARAAGG